jgi:hypothetical protein
MGRGGISYDVGSECIYMTGLYACMCIYVNIHAYTHELMYATGDVCWIAARLGHWPCASDRSPCSAHAVHLLAYEWHLPSTRGWIAGSLGTGVCVCSYFKHILNTHIYIYLWRAPCLSFFQLFGCACYICLHLCLCNIIWSI